MGLAASAGWNYVVVWDGAVSGISHSKLATGMAADTLFKMTFPLKTRFVDRASGKGVPGLIRIATEQDMPLWTNWRYGSTDDDKSWDWWSLYLL
jgi:hypothetical protein